MESMIRHVCSYLNIIGEAITNKAVEIHDIGICPCGYKKDNEFPPLSSFKPFKFGAEFGTGFDTHAWFHMNIEVPEDMRNETLELCIHTDKSGWDADNPQFLCYIDGKMRQGFDTNHRELSLSDGKASYDVYLYAYTGPRVAKAAFRPFIRTVHEEARKYYFDLLVPRLALEAMEFNSVGYKETLTTLSMSLRQLNVLEPRGKEFYDSIVKADEYLQENLYKKEKPKDITTVCIGHTHIDIAWLWTVAQTREKAQRSFATVIELMKRYPEYKFMSSQAFLYKAVKEEAPELYEEIKQMVKEGRWEVEGAMWVEADCNLTSGESLARQVIYGKNFFKEEFGIDSRVLWLPDVFGYSIALPQILKKAGVDWFVTSKISWNDMNTVPYDIFKWEGLDGTDINTFFLTAQAKGHDTNYNKGTTYVSNMDPQYVAGAYNRLQQKELSREVINTFGFGDGGGGPTYEMLEFGRRQVNGIGSLPNAKMEFAGTMLKDLEERIKDNPRLPMWRGELYLEFHRGTYTSNARNKKNNRDSEFLMLDSELLSVAAGLLCGVEFPKEVLHELWETVLVNQFHDIIPGSSIREVYEQCDKEYAELRKICAEIRENAMKKIADNVNTDKKFLVFNPHSFSGKGVVDVNGKAIYVENIPPKGYKALSLRAKSSAIVVDKKHVSTPFYDVDFDENMEITKIYDKINKRNVLAAGAKGNELRIYEDYPDQYDAWEIQEFSGYKYYTIKDYVSSEVVSKGAKTGIKIVRKHSDSTINQTIWFYDDIQRIDFETNLDWHSEHRVLRTAFPVDINTDRASFEVQFGTIERPTHKNTSWDRMKFETCAHKFADLSEGNYGVSLLNNCKYGHDVHGNTMMLTLLKCPTYPNEVADKGAHSFTYSIYPHKGTLSEADTVKEAYLLNFPMFAVKKNPETKGTLPENWSLVSIDAENVIIETVKEAENDKDIVVRMYEAKNFRGTATVKFGFDVKEVYLADIMENKLTKLSVTDNSVTINYKPFEIITLKLVK